MKLALRVTLAAALLCAGASIIVIMLFGLTHTVSSASVMGIKGRWT